MNVMSQALAPLFESISNGFLLLDRQAKATFISEAASDTLLASHSLRMEDGVLGAYDAGDAERLQQLRGRSVTSNGTKQPRCSATLVGAQNGDGIIELVAVPLGNRANGSVAIVFLFDEGHSAGVNAAILSELYGLTDTETELTALLAKGLSISSIAENLEISVHTARTHLKHVFTKTGSKRQAELVHRIEQGPASLNVDWI